ncbi:Proline-rich nuclear receptor coactivator family protein [Brugia pahangi]|uniref:TPX2_importin domain-containing protein n=1 Tax=Brugia pahangi TaxID=6280 RepID=A0A0N4TV26_BRUPA|nr:unnamed protein product [Brugia pahangi]
MHPVPSGIMHPMSSGIMHPMSSGVMHPVSSGIMHPVLSGIMHPMSSGIMHPMLSGVIRPLSSGIIHPVSSRIMHAVPSVPLALFFPNGSVSAPTTPVATKAMRNISHQTSKHSHHQSDRHDGLLCVQSGNLEKKNRNSKQWSKSEPCASFPAVNTSIAKNSKLVTSSLSKRVDVPASMAATPCFSSSAPASSNMFQSQLPSEDTSSIKSISQKQPFSLDVTPKRKTERRLARHFRRQQQSDNVNFAGAKFSESPQAKVVPLPPFIWCEEASSSSSCSGDEQSVPPITEVIEVEMARHENFHGTPKWNKCSPNLQIKPLHCVAVSPSS